MAQDNRLAVAISTSRGASIKLGTAVNSDAKLLFDELRDLTKSWTRHDLMLSRNEAREIGSKLYRLGGWPLMAQAYHFVTGINPAATALLALRDGIGDWDW